MKTLSIFIFRRDLRIEDNYVLKEALENSEKILPVFIFTEEQIGKKNKYKSDNAIQFMCNSLESLHQSLYKKMKFFYGPNNVKVINALLNNLLNNDSIRTLYNEINLYEMEDYTPYARDRTKSIDKLINTFKKNRKYSSIVFSYHLIDDLGLHPFKVLPKTYKKFSAFYKALLKLEVKSPIKITLNKQQILLLTKKLPFEVSLKKIKPLYQPNPHCIVKGTRKEAQKLLLEFKKKIYHYSSKKDFPSNNATSFLAAHLHFGTISVREIYWSVYGEKKSENFIRQLYWREFYLHIIGNTKDVFTTSFSRPYFNHLKWQSPKKAKVFFEQWCQGKTGFPLVDAALTELNVTGHMHNRMRMLVANFLVFYLRLPWKWGMDYFSKKLTDIDMANNYGNWKYQNGLETWSYDWFKPLSVIIQTKKFDSHATYIKHWLPVLKNIPSKHIIAWEKYYKKYNLNKLYPNPILIDSKLARKQGIEMFRSAFTRGEKT